MSRLGTLAIAAATFVSAMAASPGVAAPTGCRALPKGGFVTAQGGIRLYVRTIGRGRPVLMIPSLGRGASDFEPLAKSLARRHVMSILPDPRMTGRSSATPPDDLFSLASDSAAVARALCPGRVDVVGHAFGNRVARALAASEPGLVGRVVLLAGGGEVAMSPEVQKALAGSFAQGERPVAERMKDLRVAFFAQGNDPSSWLNGWFPEAAKAQIAATRRTDTARWWTAGNAPLLLIQAAEDPVAPPGNGAKLQQDVGQRLRLLTLRHASHAILPEQPRAVAATLASYFAGQDDAVSLQATLDRNTRVPTR